MSFELHDYVRHMLVEVDFLIHSSAAVNREEFLQSEVLQRAFVRSIEVIGEAAKQIPEDFRALHSKIEWRAMAGMRDHLIHGYFGVDYEIVWDVAKEKAPELRRQLERILGSEPR
ncbi:MAG: DUF86 domain-containing protein [Planctomycetota bacterium]|nr:MAG: DUF86 domain-containing protein [Planctomycetota bacterium]